MLQINGSMFLMLIIDGKEYPVEDNNLHSLRIMSHVFTGLPTCQVVISDNVAFFVENVTMADGITISITIGEDENDKTVYPFRVFSFKQVNTQGSTAYCIDCYYDAPKFLSDIATRPYKGPSSSVMEEIAGECGLSSKVDATSDAMLWIPRNDAYQKFARKVAEHGYVGDTSVMVCCVDLAGTLKYLDLTKIPTSGPIFSRSQKEGIPIYDSESVASSGFVNHYNAYRSSNVDFTILKDPFFKIEKDVTIKKNSQFLMLNIAVKGMISKGRREFMPIDCGNVHANYQRAFYQNRRAASVYNFSQNILTNRNTKIQLLDPLTYKTSTVSGSYEKVQKSDVGDSGGYFVTARTLVIYNGEYQEKLTITRQGLNDDPSGTGTQE